MLVAAVLGSATTGATFVVALCPHPVFVVVFEVRAVAAAAGVFVVEEVVDADLWANFEIFVMVESFSMFAATFPTLLAVVVALPPDNDFVVVTSSLGKTAATPTVGC